MLPPGTSLSNNVETPVFVRLGARRAGPTPSCLENVTLENLTGEAASGIGELSVPARVTDETPVVLLIHGGGWIAMDKKDVVGIADFLVRDCVSISGIADTNCEKWGKMTATWKDVNPVDLIRPGGPKILLTHATEDRIVTVDSAKSFARAYRAAGNELVFFEYPAEIEHGLTGHCIWRPGSRPHRLIQALERRISSFMLPSRVSCSNPRLQSIFHLLTLSSQHPAGRLWPTRVPGDAVFDIIVTV